VSHLAPPVWDSERLELDRRTAIHAFREARMSAPLTSYVESFDRHMALLQEIFELTVDLTQIVERAEEVMTSKDRITALRYLAGPMISKDDLETLADTSIAPSVLAKDPGTARAVVETILLGLDPRRFPWLEDGRRPSEMERQAALVATASLLALQRVRTDRMNESAAEQQEAVIAALVDAGFVEVERRRVRTLKEAPAAGEVSRSGMFGGRDADLVVGVWDGRVMPVECKVSNSSTNSVKRLNNDAAAKAEVWIRDFGRRQVVPVAVLSGVFKLHNLEAAQDAGLTLFWAHALDAMVDWIDALR